MKNSTTIPMNGTKDETNLKRLLSSMNDREIQEIYTHVRIENLSEDFISIADDMELSGCITSEELKLIKENKKDLAIHFMDSHDMNIPDADLMSGIIDAFLNDMRNRPVVMLAQHNRNLFVRKFNTLVEARKAMLQKIEILMEDNGIKIDVSLPNYRGIYCNWDAMSGQINFMENTYDWKIVYESDIPSNS